jgi:hypothetical protein
MRMSNFIMIHFFMIRYGNSSVYFLKVSTVTIKLHVGSWNLNRVCYKYCLMNGHLKEIKLTCKPSYQKKIRTCVINVPDSVAILLSLQPFCRLNQVCNHLTSCPLATEMFKIGLSSFPFRVAHNQVGHGRLAWLYSFSRR